MVAHAIVVGIQQGKLELPVIPTVASKIFSLTNDSNADMSELSKLIHGDQSIASHVLRIANTAAYTSGEPIVSLQQAVTRLGMKLLGEIAVAVTLQNDLFSAPGFETQIKRLLSHALAAAAYGREIARMRRRNVEGQFLCGLLHSIGEPICLQLIARVQKEKSVELEECEARMIVAGLSPKVATKIAVDWKLPKQLQITTVFHRRYETAPTFKDECAATCLSRLLANWVFQTPKTRALELSRHPAVEFLNIYPDEFQELLAKKEEVRSVVASMEL